MCCTADGLCKQIVYQGVRKGSNGTECYRLLCERLVLGGSEWSLCVGNDLVPVCPFAVKPFAEVKHF